MELHQFRDFVAVADAGNFHEAAQKIHVCQPALSKAIQRLEIEVGEKLFVRLKRRVLLTPAGEIFYPRALRVISAMDGIKRDIADTNGLKRGHLNIGILPTIAPYVLPKVLKRFTDACPMIDVSVQEETTADLLRLASMFQLDLAILSLPLHDKSFEKRILFTEELLLAMPSKHPLAANGTIRLTDLENEYFILMKEGHCLGDQVLSFCRKNALRLKVMFESSQIETVHSLITIGFGISLIPQIAKKSGSLVYRSLEPKPTRTIVAIWRKERPLTRAATEFLKHLEQTTKHLVGN